MTSLRPPDGLDQQGGDPAAAGRRVASRRVRRTRRARCASPRNRRPSRSRTTLRTARHPWQTTAAGCSPMIASQSLERRCTQYSPQVPATAGIPAGQPVPRGQQLRAGAL